MGCVNKDDIVDAIVGQFWAEFGSRFPEARRAAMQERFDGKEVASASDAWWVDKEETQRNGATVTLVSRCDGDEVTFELVRS